MPPHMLPVLGSSTVVNIVGVCDSILYKAISGVLMPTVLQALPDRYAFSPIPVWQVLGHFSVMENNCAFFGVLPCKDH